MKKIGLGILITLIVLTISGVATAMIRLPAADQAKEKADKSPIVEINGDNLMLTPPGLEKIIYIHYKKDFAKPPWAGRGKGNKEAKCYGFLAKGAIWKDLSLDYVIDIDNLDGLSKNLVVSAISAGAEEWDFWTESELFDNTYEIVHDGTWDNDFPDYRNELLFEDYPDSNVIAVTVIWGYFSGPPSSREIIEFDVLFNTDFVWGNATGLTIDSEIMDLENIAVHEIGHGVGLADMYDTTCDEVTMYGYSGYGDIEKRTLAPADIIGIQTLYGRL